MTSRSNPRVGGQGVVTEDGPAALAVGGVTHAGGGAVVGHEMTATGTLTATDVDNLQSDLTWQVVKAPADAHGTLAVDPATGQWTYTLDNASPAVQTLTQGQIPADVFTVEVIHGHGDTAQTYVYVKVEGTVDNPVISVGTGDTDRGAVTEDAAKTTVSGTLTVTDVDTPQPDVSHPAQVWSIGPQTASGGTSLHLPTQQAGAYGTFSIDKATGAWSYTLDNARPETQALTARETRHETFEVRVTDDHFGTTTHTVTIDVTGTGEGAQVAGTDSATVTEDQNLTGGSLTAYGTLTIADPDPGEAEFTPVPAGAGQYGTFTLDAQGHWTYAADNSQAPVQQLAPGTHLTDTLTVTSVDGTTHDITVTIEGTNDDPVVTSGSNPRVGGAGAVTEDGPQAFAAGGLVGIGGLVVSGHETTASGTLTATDVDNAQGDLTCRVVSGPQDPHGTLVVDGKTGQWTDTLDNDNPTVQSLAQGKAPSDVFKVAVTDGHGGTSETLVYFKVEGTNDAPVIRVETGDSDHGAVTEDAAKTTVSGTLTVSDVDVEANNIAGGTGGGLTTSSGGTAETWSVDPATPGTYGTLSVDQHGEWTYTLDNTRPETQGLTAGHTVQESFTVTVTDSHNASTTHTVTIDVTGAGEGAVIGGVDTAQLTEDRGLSAGQLTADGQLTVTDADPGEAHFTPLTGAAGAATYGTFTLTADGTWTYTADNSQQAVQDIGPGQSLTDTIQVTSVDGTTHDITVTIQGAIDAPSVGATVGTSTVTPGHAEALATGTTVQSSGFVLHGFTYGEAYRDASGNLLDPDAGAVAIGARSDGFGVSSATGVPVDGWGRPDVQAAFTIDTASADPHEVMASEEGETLVVELQGLSRTAHVSLQSFGPVGTQGHSDWMHWAVFDENRQVVDEGAIERSAANQTGGVVDLQIDTAKPFAYITLEAMTPPGETTTTGGTAHFHTNIAFHSVQAELIRFETPSRWPAGPATAATPTSL